MSPKRKRTQQTDAEQPAGNEEHLSLASFPEGREFASFVKASAEILSNLDLGTVLRTMAEQLAQFLDVEACVFSRWDQGQETISTSVKYLRGEMTVWDPSEIALTKRFLTCLEPK